MNQNNSSDPLAKYRLQKSEESPAMEDIPQESPKKETDKKKDFDPLEKYRKKTESNKLDVSDPISEALISKGYEPDTSEEFERLYEKGQAEAVKGLLSGATLGLSKLIPGAKPKDNVVTTANEAIGSALPIGGISKGVAAAGSKLFSKPLLTLAAKSPLAAKSLTALGGLAGVGLTGATIGALDEATESGELKAPSVENAIEHGATWVALDAALQGLGIGGRFAKGVIKKSRSANKSRVDVINETLESLKERGVDISTDKKTAEAALSVLEDKSLSQVRTELKNGDNPTLAKQQREKQTLAKEVEEKGADLKSRKIEQQTFNKLDESVVPNAKPYFPNEFSAAEIVEESLDSQLNELIDSVAPRAETRKELGENIQSALQDSFSKAKAEYDPLYNKAQTEAEKIFVTSKDTALKATEMLKKIEGYNVNPAGYKITTREIENALEDAGFSLVRDENGVLKESLQNAEVSVSKLMELKRRLNKMANFDNIEPSVQSLLGSLSSSVKQDIISGLGKNPEALKAFQEAERKFGETADKFKRKSIKTARYSEKPESIKIDEPSELANLKNIVSEDQFKQIQRELLEDMKTMKLDKASNFYRELRPSMDEDTRFLAENILESKRPNRSATIRKEAQEGIYKDLSKASITGERPTKSLNLWKTTEGQQLIKHSLKGNPNEKEVLKYLEEQSLADFTSSVVSADGTIDFKKFNELMKDKATLENLRLLGGEQGVQFFRQLESLSQQLDKNLNSMEQRLFRKAFPDETMSQGKKNQLYKENTAQAEDKFKKIAEKNKTIFHKFEDLFDRAGKKTKILLAGLGIVKFSAPEVVGVTLGYHAMKKLLTNKTAQLEFKKAVKASKSGNINSTINALDDLNDEMKK